jgi:hypothetical protein
MIPTLHVGKTDKVPVQNGQKQGDAYSPLLFIIALGMPPGGSKRTRKD